MNYLYCFLFLFSLISSAQPTEKYWQQHAAYTMEVDMDVTSFQYTGKQELVYTNNSPDTLKKVFYHLYFNAFQPNSEMDIRSRTISDPDPRVLSRIAVLKPSEVGYLKISKFTHEGTILETTTAGTILEIPLKKYINPGEKTTFKLDFQGQVPQQIRRSGRNNAEGVALSMSQWYPKISEYDFEGWHANPYIGREFHGVWGDFDVKITIDKTYILGGTGYLQNGKEIGYGYEPKGAKVKQKGRLNTWHFIAPKVHDFTWAADPDYVHDVLPIKNGPELHFLYKNDPEITPNWKRFQKETEKLLAFFSEKIGPYPYKQYSIIQGGDGGMEYAMCTLITGKRSFGSLLGVTAHEMAHAWFQHLLATNESKHEWMDEGFTSYISSIAMAELLGFGKENPHAGAYESYIKLAQSGIEQPQTTHADRFTHNAAYGASAYSKGQVFLNQLGYIIGEENLSKTLKKYYQYWKFKHPTPNDFKRIAEKVSGIELDWYLTDWTKTTNQIDYKVLTAKKNGSNTTVTLKRIGAMPMPIELEITYQDDQKEHFYIPLQMMRGEKPVENGLRTTLLKDWSWANPEYEFEITHDVKKIKEIRIDPLNKMADVNRANNVLGSF